MGVFNTLFPPVLAHPFEPICFASGSNRCPTLLPSLNSCCHIVLVFKVAMTPSIRPGMILFRLRSILSLGKPYCYIIYLAAGALSQISSSTVPGHDNRIAYRNADKASMYSYKLRKSGFRTIEVVKLAHCCQMETWHLLPETLCLDMRRHQGPAELLGTSAVSLLMWQTDNILFCCCRRKLVGLQCVSPHSYLLCCKHSSG